MALKAEQQRRAVETMKGLPLFAGCAPEALQALAAAMNGRQAPKGRVVLMEQEVSRTLYLVMSGSVGVWRRQGGEKKLVATLKAPDFFGETSMFRDLPATALVKAEEDCELFTLDRAAFDGALPAFPPLAGQVQSNMAAILEKRPPLVRPPSEPENP